ERVALVDDAHLGPLGRIRPFGRLLLDEVADRSGATPGGFAQEPVELDGAVRHADGGRLFRAAGPGGPGLLGVEGRRDEREGNQRAKKDSEHVLWLGRSKLECSGRAWAAKSRRPGCTRG